LNALNEKLIEHTCKTRENDNRKKEGLRYILQGVLR